MTEDHGEQDVMMMYRTAVGNHCRWEQGEENREKINRRQNEVTLQEVLPKLADTPPKDIGVIAPYKYQLKKLALELKESSIETKTVHKFQGREKDAIVFMTVDDKVTTEFSDKPDLLNVAITRAKKKFCLVVSGNEQPKDSNTQDLIDYIKYNNFEVVDSEIHSVFDLLYQQYTKERLAYLQTHKRISQYDSENIMYGVLTELLKTFQNLPLKILCHQQLRLIIRNLERLTEEERKYVSRPGTHVDFCIYNPITKRPVLVIEVDGFNFHKEGSKQAERDKLKDSILKKYGIEFLRLPTNGSGEIEKIKNKLKDPSKDNGCGT